MNRLFWSVAISTNLSLAMTLGLLSCDSKKKDVKPSKPSPGTSTNTVLDPKITGCLRLTQDDQDSWGDGTSTGEAKTDEDSKQQEDKKTSGDATTNCSIPAPSTPSTPSPSQGQDPKESQNTDDSQGTSTGTGTQAPAPAPTPAPPPSPTPGGDPGLAQYSVGPGIDGCYAQGKVWKAVDSSQPGKSGSCGESLVNYCCSQSDVLSKFASSKSFLEPEFAKSTSQGLVLYGCSSDGSSKTTFHFAKYDGNNWSYRTLYITAKSDLGTPPAACPKASLSDLGYKP